MNIKLELEVTPDQLVRIATILNDGVEVVESLSKHAHKDDTGETTASPEPAGSLFANSPEPVQGHPHQGAYQGIGADGTLNTGETIAPPPPPPTTDDTRLAKSTTGEMIPWDERIHAASKKINATDGSWRLKKGVDRENLVPTVEAELAGVEGDVAPPANNTPPPPPPPAELKTISTFPELLPLVTAAQRSGKLPDTRLSEVLGEIGLSKFGELAVRTDKVAEFAARAGLTND